LKFAMGPILRRCATDCRAGVTNVVPAGTKSPASTK